jgi:hypothetical protein
MWYINDSCVKPRFLWTVLESRPRKWLTEIVIYLNRFESLEHHDHTLLRKPFHKLRGVQMPAVACESRGGDVATFPFVLARTLLTVFEAGNEHLVTDVLEQVCIPVAVDVSPFFGFVVSFPISVV